MKKIVSLILMLTLCMGSFTACVSDGPMQDSTGLPENTSLPEDTTAEEAGKEYKISYDLDGGSWKSVYYTLDELFAQFKEDFNSAGGKISVPSDLDTAHLESSDFVNVYTSTGIQVKWFWLLRALWEVSEKDSAVNPRTCDLKSNAAKAFFLTQLCGFFTQTQHTDTYLKSVSSDFSDPSILNTVIESGPAKESSPGEESYISGRVTGLRVLTKKAYVFVGWSTGEGIITSIDEKTTGDLTLKAVWEEATKPSDVMIEGIPYEGVGIYNTLQLKLEVLPADAYDKDYRIKSLNTNIVTVDSKGVVTAKAAGTATLQITLPANPDFIKTVEIKVYKGNYFEAKYLTESYTFVGENVGLSSVFHDAYGVTHDVSWSSLTPGVATVNEKGTVHPLATGLATIRAAYDETHYVDFTVTVLDTGVSDAMKLVLKSHNSNAKTVYDLGIGDGTPAYYYDVTGSVSDLLFDTLKIDKTYYEKLASGENNYGPMSSVEFVTVHYTGNMNKGADADNNAAYFSNKSSGVSIHYVTGRSNLASYGGDWSPDSYVAFACLNESYGAWHASTGSNECIWDATGISYKEGDPETPEISVSDDLYYTINGQKTLIKIPTVPDGYTVKGNSVTAGGVTATAINSMGLITKVSDGQYYLARTWWGKQRTPKALSTYGGNKNSIGIESCVDIGSDLVHTWHVTAQLVADILIRNNLTLDRVVGHHFFSAKNCPQPLLENDLELWNEFMDMVRAEYALRTGFEGVTITARAVDGKGILSDKGLLKQTTETNIVTYEVTIEQNGKTEKVTLATAVESSYACDCTRKQQSLQQQGYEIK